MKTTRTLTALAAFTLTVRSRCCSVRLAVGEFVWVLTVPWQGRHGTRHAQ
jgi:hypothetical protein